MTSPAQTTITLTADQDIIQDGRPKWKPMGTTAQRDAIQARAGKAREPSDINIFAPAGPFKPEKEQRILDDFRYLCQVAIHEWPAPFDDAMQCRDAVRILVRAGWIMLERYGRPWRRITILVGEHAWQRTAPCPGDAEPFRISGGRGKGKR